jgi:hypothetical protein
MSYTHVQRLENLRELERKLQSDSKLLSGFPFILVGYGNPDNNLESLCISCIILSAEVYYWQVRMTFMTVREQEKFIAFFSGWHAFQNILRMSQIFGIAESVLVMGWTAEKSEFGSMYGQDFSLHVVQTGSMTHLSSYLMGTRN